MSTTGQLTIKYENPPINEIVCGILFDSITELRSGHLGILWQKFRPDFSGIEDQNLLGLVSEDDLNNHSILPLPRVWFVHEDKNELIQVQFNRFLHNWRKIQPDDKYPGYETVIENFEKYLSRFQEFLAEEKLGNLVPNRYEITYINHIWENEGWETISDLEKIFPDFISLKDPNILSADIQEINWQMVFDLLNDLGQLKLSIRNARRISDGRHLLRIEFTVLSNQADKPMRDWFDLAHEAIIELFSNLISDEIQEAVLGEEIMPNVSSAAMIGQYIKSSPFPLGEDFTPNIPEHPEQDRGTSPGLQYGIRSGITQEDIPRREASKQFYVIVQPEDNIELHPHSWMMESPTATIDLHRTDNNIILDVLSGSFAKFVRVVGGDLVPTLSDEVAVVSLLRKKPILDELLARFDVIAQREDNWDGYESKKPIELSLDRAKRLMEKLLDTVISGGHSWLAPFISSDEDGYITVEWYGEERQLHLRIEEDEVEYIKLQRTNTQREVHVEAIRSDDCFALWKWLIYG